MTSIPVQELETRIQQLSLSDQLWLMEKLAQRIRIKFNDASGPWRENGEPYSNGSATPPHSKMDYTTETMEQGDEMTEESDIFHVKPDSPLYEDLKQILEDKKQGKLKFHSYAAVFGK